jgi:uncharacterized peroxidase-related enzyme
MSYHQIINDMAHIKLDESLPGMRRLLAYYPTAAPPLTGLMQVMMRGDLGLNKGERELIAAFVSGLNKCAACENIHSVVAGHLFNIDLSVVETIKINFQAAPISLRLKSILSIADQVHRGGKYVTRDLVENAKSVGITDQEIHDTVLISALFCMYNRYLDGLGVQSTDTLDSLDARGQHIALHGYSG